MRPQKVLFTGNCEFRYIAIANYFNKLGILGITRIMRFPIYCKDIIID